jgi:hypothetical protein
MISEKRQSPEHKLKINRRRAQDKVALLSLERALEEAAARERIKEMPTRVVAKGF